MEIFEKEYSPDISIEDAIILSLRALKKSIEGELSKNNVEMAVISLEDKKFKKIDEESLNSYIEKVKEIKEEEDEE
ncbi:MAG: Proteasome subunit alpha [Candidatus Methanofastidiosum methylothiophilum]|uniref:Proteasome subunit alpha n=1 Tax=Candidatus Methanofastidiosum methylothiophilum TaxID=1705564 RepID=A0A150J6K7_9EURY|nr:MAG: Proteasome subunit alpha [Candidatus Methanofastidiosum methylthiophilus]